MDLIGVSQKFGGIGLSKQARTITEIRGSEKVPINVRLQDKRKYFSTSLRLTPRRYQVELYEKALKENVIIYLGTGLGKTFIIVMMLNSPNICAQISQGRKVVFMAPTQDLVKQQAEYICRNVAHKVKVYCGRTCNLGIHIDHWNKSDWDKELDLIDIFFMTPAIFVNAISTKILSWSNFSLVIFDEGHHAATSKAEKAGKKVGHFYSQVLKNYHALEVHKSPIKPRLVGLSASLVNNMPKNVGDIQAGIYDIERKFYAKCVTDLSAISSKPQLVISSFNDSKITKHNDILIATLLNCSDRLSDAVEAIKIKRMADLGPVTDEDRKILSYQNRLKLASSGFSIKPTSLHKVLKQLARIRTNTGLWTLTNICHNLHIAMEKHSKNPVVVPHIRPIYIEFGAILQLIVSEINKFLSSEPRNLLIDYSQPKLVALLETLLQQYYSTKNGVNNLETFSCIVFVRSRIEVVAICGWLRMVSEHIPEYSFIKADYAIGMSSTMTSKWACITKRRSSEQSAMLENFRLGQLNVIVTTSVLEEGIDLPVCSTVIRFDDINTFREYVQSRGRARQQASSFIAMCELSKMADVHDRLKKFNDFENKVKEILKSGDLSIEPPLIRNSRVQSTSDCRDDDTSFLDKDKGILIQAGLAKVVLGMYCQRLAKRCPYADGLSYTRKKNSDGLYTTTLFFSTWICC